MQPELYRTPSGGLGYRRWTWRDAVGRIAFNLGFVSLMIFGAYVFLLATMPSYWRDVVLSALGSLL